MKKTFWDQVAGCYDLVERANRKAIQGMTAYVAAQVPVGGGAPGVRSGHRRHYYGRRPKSQTGALHGSVTTYLKGLGLPVSDYTMIPGRLPVGVAVIKKP